MIALLSKSMLMAIICPSCRHRGAAPDNVLPRDMKCSQCGKGRWFQKGKRLSTGFRLARAAAERDLADEIVPGTDVSRTSTNPVFTSDGCNDSAHSEDTIAAKRLGLGAPFALLPTEKGSET
jgi:hypothetical protein